MLRRGLAAFAVVLALWGFALPAAAQEPTVVDMSIEGADRITVGDRFFYVITIQAPEGTEVQLPPGSLPGAMSLVGPPQSQTRSLGNGTNEITLRAQVAAFAPGDIPVPPLRILYRDSEGVTGEISAPASRITVASVLPAGGDLTPRDLKPQAEIGEPSAMGLILTALAGVLVALLLVLALLYRLTRPKPAVVVAEIDTSDLSIEDQARALLDRAGQQFAEDRDFITYYAAIAVTIRNYLTARYGFPAFALTTRELHLEMARRGIDRWQTRLVNGLLTECDAAVYAHFRPALERADHDLTAAYEIVEMSRPKPVEAEEEETKPEGAAVS